MLTGIKQRFQAYDYLLIVLIVVLSVFGLIIVGSATRLASGADSPIYTSQKIWLVSGFAIMIAVSLFDYQFICRLYIPLYCISTALLVLVLIVGSSNGEAQRWLYFPRIGSWRPGIQPSEFAKLFMLIFLAKYIDKMQEKINNIFVLSSIAALGLLPTFLIFEQPSLSASILQLVILLSMLFMSKVRYKIILIALAVVIPLLVFIRYDVGLEDHIIVDIIFREYQLEKRVKPFFEIGEVDKNDLFQTEQSKKALSSGMMTGRGLYGNVTDIPLSYNDFIFAIIGAEFGFAGAVLVLILIFLIVIKCFIIAERADSFCGKLLSSGVGVMLGAQAFVHVGVTTGLLPNTGIPLPFVSAGGSSMWINFAAVGMVLNIGLKRDKTMFAD